MRRRVLVDRDVPALGPGDVSLARAADRGIDRRDFRILGADTCGDRRHGAARPRQQFADVRQHVSGLLGGRGAVGRAGGAVAGQTAPAGGGGGGATGTAVAPGGGHGVRLRVVGAEGVGVADAAAAAGGGGKVELTLVNWAVDTEKKAFDAVIAAFEQANPDITIKTDTVPYASIQTNIDSRFQAGNPPDLFRVSYIDIGQYTSQDVLLDVSSTFDQAAVDAFVPVERNLEDVFLEVTR